jgi:polyisoprenoid-binding protein YceI
MTDLTTGTWIGHWVLDPERSSVRLRAASMGGLVKATGRFAELRGEGTWDDDGTATGTLVIDAASLDTGNKRRDKHLRSNDFFDVATHPEITYTISGITPESLGQVRVTGELRIVDHTHPLALTATLEDADPTGATLATESALDRTRWGIGPKTGILGKTAWIDARLRFTRRP